MADISTTLDNIVSHWELEEASGTRVDSYGSNDLNDNNTVGQDASGIQANAADFVAANSEYLSITDAAQSGLDFTGSKFSFSFWVKLASLPSAGAMNFISKQGNNPNRQYIIRSNTDNKIQAEISGDGTTTHLWQQTSNSAIWSAGDIGNWVHIVVTFDASTDSIIFYKNGSVVPSTLNKLGSPTAIANTTSPFEIGRDGRAFYYVDGSIDEVTATSDVITSSEVTTIYNSGAGIPYAGGTTVSPNAQAATFSVPTYTVTAVKNVAPTPTTQSATFSVPTATVLLSKTITPAVQTATFTIPGYAIVGAGFVTLTPDAQVATFSVPTYTVAVESNVAVAASAQAATFSVPTYMITIVANRTISASVLTATFSIPDIERAGGLWQPIARVEDADEWSAISRQE